MSHDRRAFLSLGGAAVAASALPAAAARPPETYALDTELARLRQVDPRLIGYDEVDRIVLDIKDPCGIGCGLHDRLWVVGDRALILFVAGRATRRVQLSSAPSCVSESPDGERVYVGLGDTIEVFALDGGRIASWALRGESALMTSIAACGRFVFVADPVRRTVQRRDTEGRDLGRIGDAPGATGHFVVPSAYLDLAVTRDGVLWVTNPGEHRVESYSLDGRALSAFGASGSAIGEFCGCCNPTHIAALPDGRLVTSEKGLPRVKVMRPSGGLESVVAAGERLAPGAVGLDLAANESGAIFVLDPRARAVRVFKARDEGATYGR